jgi:glycerate 2-kinase
MKIVIAPESYKESLSALDVAREIKKGFLEVFPSAEYVLMPVADGGEGTVEAMVAATNGTRVEQTVVGPLGREVRAFYGLTGDRTAILEIAAAAGLTLVPIAERNPLLTTTYGVGQLIRSALDAGSRRFIIGVGGSATNDGGAGMFQALGGHLYDAHGQELSHGCASLAKLAHIDVKGLDPRISECTIDVACDVDNPLVGPGGASAVFGPQKGATPEIVRQLDDNLCVFARIVREQLGGDVETLPGGGAAGGLGAGMHAFLRARLRPGVEIVMQAVGMDDIVRHADLVITGEGRMDGQTLRGKTPIGVAAVARRHKKPVIGIVGCLGDGASSVHQHGIDAVYSVLSRSCSVPEALAEASVNIKQTARNIAMTLKIGGFGSLQHTPHRY